MEETIGQTIARIAKSQGLTQAQFGAKINLTKQGIASIYKRSTIDVSLLSEISGKLNYDFFKHLYEREPMLSFKQKEIEEWELKIEKLSQTLTSNQDLLKEREKMIATQEKLIQELEEKVKKKR